MNFKTTYILFGTFVVLLLFLLISQKGQKETTNVGYLLPSLQEANVKAKDIDYVEIERKSPKAEKLVFQRSDRGWRLANPAARAQTMAVDDLINEVLRAAKDEREADLTSNLEQFGLKEPATIVTLKTASGKQWQLYIGAESGGGKDSLVYVNSSDLPKEVLAVRHSQLDHVFKSVNDFRSRDLLAEGAFNFSDVVNLVKLQSEKGAPVVLQKNDKNRWKFDKPPYGDADDGDAGAPPGPEASRSTGMKGLLTNLADLKVASDADFVADDVTDMAKYGLVADKPAWLRVEIQRRQSNIAAEGENKTVDDVLLIGNKTDDTGEKRFARLASETTVVRLPSQKIDAIFAIAENPSTLRNRDLVEIDSFKTDAINIENAAGKIELRHTGTPETWKLYQGATLVADADNGAVQDLIGALNAKRQVKEFIDNDKVASLGFDKPSAVVSLWVEGIKKDAKKDEAKKDEGDKKVKPEGPQLKSEQPTIKLTFGKKEKDLVYVQREAGGDKSVVTVADSLLAKVSQQPLAYRERILPSFSESADVTKVTLHRGKDTFVLERTKKDDKAPAEWTFKEPKELVNKNADGKSVDRILMELRRLRTDRLVSEKTGDLDQYGLKQPQLQATVTIKKGEKETEDFVYLFGKDTTDGLFAKQGQRDMIFVAQPRDLDAALHAELQDPTVFHYDAGRVKNLTLTGWESLGIGTQALKVERATDKSWSATQPPSFNLDAQQVDNFVTTLSDLKAERFVARGTGPQPAHRLGDKERIVTITISLEGDEKNPLTLTLGALDPGAKAYFASSSTLPKDVFLLPQSKFEKLAMEGMKFFSKAK